MVPMRLPRFCTVGAQSGRFWHNCQPFAAGGKATVDNIELPTARTTLTRRGYSLHVTGCGASTDVAGRVARKANSFRNELPSLLSTYDRNVPPPRKSTVLWVVCRSAPLAPVRDRFRNLGSRPKKVVDTFQIDARR